MNQQVIQLYELIKRYRLDWRRPERLKRIVKKIEQGKMRPQEAKRWLRTIRPWVEEQQRCFNPLHPAPSQAELGHFDVELGHLKEAPNTQTSAESK